MCVIVPRATSRASEHDISAAWLYDFAASAVTFDLSFVRGGGMYA